MNKIIKSSGKWRALPRRVSPMLNFVQACLIVAIVVLLISTLKYRKHEETFAAKGVWNTVLIDDMHPLGKVSGELDPVAFLSDHPGRKALPAVMPAADTFNFRVIDPKTESAAVAISEFKKFNVADTVISVDATVNSANSVPAVEIPANNIFAVMYDESGREITRWQCKIRNSNAPTLFRVNGKGELQYCSLIASCGDAESDAQVLRTADKMPLANGLYTVYYPFEAVENKKGMK